jgi:hypothetical protein
MQNYGYSVDIYNEYFFRLAQKDKRIKMKYFGVLVFLALVCFSSIACAPVNSTNSSHVQWNNKASSFLIKVYKHLVSTGGDLSRLVGAKQIVGVYATVKRKCEGHR